MEHKPILVASPGTESWWRIQEGQRGRVCWEVAHCGDLFGARNFAFNQPPTLSTRNPCYLQVECHKRLRAYACHCLSPLQWSIAQLWCTPGQENRGGGVRVKVRGRNPLRRGWEGTEALRHPRHWTAHTGAGPHLDIGEQFEFLKRCHYCIFIYHWNMIREEL